MTEPFYVVLGGYPAATLAIAVLKANLIAAVVIAAVAALRVPARRAFGPAAAYHLWGAPPVAAFLTLLVEVARPHESPAIFAFDGTALAVSSALWFLGALCVGTIFALAQARFLAEVRDGRGGPAVVVSSRP